MIRRRKRKQPSDAFTSELRSLLLYPDIMITIQFYLSLGDIATAIRSSRDIKNILDDNSTWEIRCKKILQGKVNIPDIIHTHISSRKGKSAMREAIKYQRQTYITEDQIMRSRWYFKKKHCSCRHQSNDNACESVQVREIGSDGMVYEIASCGKRLKCDIDGRPMTWRLVDWVPTISNSRLQYTIKKQGSFLRIGWLPTMYITRHSNWGFVLENLWAVATDFPTETPALDIADNITFSQQAVEVMLCGLGLSLPITISEGKTLLRRFRWILRERLGLIVGDGSGITSDDTIDYDTTDSSDSSSDSSSFFSHD